MIKGTSKNIGLPPIAFKDLDPKENYIPFHVDLRNGVITRAGNWAKRPGYDSNWDISFNDSSDLLIPVNNGFAVTETHNRVYELKSTPVRITGQDLTGTERPQWIKFGDDISIWDGGTPVKLAVSGGIYVTTALAGSPPSGKYVGRVGAYSLAAGHDDTQFNWSAANNMENWTTGDSGFANVKKTGVIKFARDYKNLWFIWKDNELEIWNNRGGSTPFVRLNELTIPIGLGSSYSVVEANQTLYWIDNDRKFRVLNGNRAELISAQYESYIFDNIQHWDEIYGINFEKEHSIRWFSPNDGICLKYDYESKFWSEDNHYEHGQFERLPMNSYMELNGKQYFGDFNPTGLIHEWSSDNKDDNGNIIRVLRDFRIRLTESGNSAVVNRMRFEFEQGVDTLSETSPEVLIRWNFDNQNSEPEWFTETLALNISPDFDPYAEIFGMGIGRIMRVQIIETDSVKFLVTGAKITVDEKVI